MSGSQGCVRRTTASQAEDPAWTVLDAGLRKWAFAGGGREPQHGSKELLREDGSASWNGRSGEGASRGPKGNSSGSEGEDLNRVQGRVSGPRT